MAIPTTTSASVYSERWSAFLRTTEQMRLIASRIKARCDSPGTPVPTLRVAEASSALVGLRSTLDSLVVGARMGTPSFADYAQGQVVDPTIDIVAAYQSLDSAHQALITWLDAQIPAIGISGFQHGQLTQIELTDPQKAAVSAQFGTYLDEFAT